MARKLLFLFFLSSVLVSASAQGSLGKEFWLCFIQNYSATNKPDSLFISVSSQNNCKVWIDAPLLGYIDSFNLSANSLKRIYLDRSVYEARSSESIEKKGLRIRATEPVSVYAMSAQAYTTDATNVFPVSAIPPNPVFYTMAHKKGGMDDLIGIVGIDDSCTVEYTLAAASSGGTGANVAKVVKLKQGEVYQIKLTGENAGSMVRVLTPGKKIAVFSGNICTNLGAPNSACDHIYEEVPPLTTLGKKFLITPFHGQGVGYYYRVLATVDSTSVFENGTYVKGLNKGEYWSQYIKVDSATCLFTSKPCLVSEYMLGGSKIGGSDPALLYVNPLEQTVTAAIVSTSNTSIIKSHFISVAIPKAGLNNLAVDGVTIGQSDFQKMKCDDYYFYSNQVSPGNHSITCSAGFIAYIYGTGSYESYAYSAGSALKNLNMSFVYDILPSCDSGAIVKFTAKGDTSKYYRWDFGDGKKDSGIAVYHKYSKPGNYLVKLEYNFIKAPGVSYVTNIVAIKPIFTDFLPLDSLSICRDSAFILTTPYSPTYKYLWTNGDTTHYTKVVTSGKYKLKITERMSGCELKDSTYIKKYNTIKADFKYHAKLFCPGNTLHFEDSSTLNGATVKKYQWFIDYYPASTKKIDSIVNTPENNYDIKLRVTTTNGCVDSIQKRVVIRKAPLVSFKIVKNDTCIRANNFNFYNFSYARLGTLTGYSWNFGDNTTSTEMMPFKKYKDTGKYLITLKAFDDYGCSNFQSTYVRIYPAPSSTIQLVDSNICIKRNSFTFKNPSPTTPNTMYQWDWGDGSGYVGKDPVVQNYLATGTYKVAHSVGFTKTGCWDTSFKTVTVYDQPVAKLALTASDYCLNTNYFKFVNQSTTPDINRTTALWEWGDGTFSNTYSNITKTYSNDTVYKLRLMITMGKGCEDTTKWKAITVYPSPIAKISLVDSNICLPTNYFKVKNTSITNGYTNIWWNFGSGTSTNISVKDTVLKYTAIGKYLVKLKLQYPTSGCVDSSEIMLNVEYKPTSSFTFTTKNYCAKDSIRFTSTSSSPYRPLLYQWNWDDGNFNNTDSIAKYAYSKDSNYKVKLVVTTPHGCSDTSEKALSVYELPKISFLTNRDTQCYRGHS
ncbi:MAG: PKD domain-containing protein, partial [Bacteroidota bacterium]